MRLYLDTSCLINLIEREEDEIQVEEFRRVLTERNHTLVLSFPLITELIKPLWDRNSQTRVTRTLNRLEEFPHIWINLTRLPSLEVRAALDSFRRGVDYKSPQVYVGGFLDTMVNPPALSRGFIRYSLAEIAFDLHSSGTFNPSQQTRNHVKLYRQLMLQERELAAQLGGRERARLEMLVRRIIERIQREELYAAGEADDRNFFRAVAEHVSRHPDWCPALRLVFEMFHALVDNMGDQLEDGDLGDLSHAYAVPYVDLFSADRRITDYFRRASDAMGIPFHSRVHRNLRSVIEML